MSDVAGWRDDRVNLTGRGEPSELRADLVTSNFFVVLGVPASLGRTFTVASAFNVVRSEVVLSHGFWQRRYGGDAAVIGQSLTLDGRSFTIIGVMPERFAIRTLELAESRPDVWLPLALMPGDADAMSGILHVVGRLKAGVTPERAEAELSLIARNVEGRQPSSTREWSIEAVPLLEATVRDVRLTMLVLAGAVTILLLIACANVGNLLLSRGAARRQELAIRQSLGATAGRLVRQLLTESFLLAAIGGVLGVVMAVVQTKLLISALPTSLDFPRIGEVTTDARMLVFALSVTSLSAMLFGLVPAWMSASFGGPACRCRHGTRVVLQRSSCEVQRRLDRGGDRACSHRSGGGRVAGSQFLESDSCGSRIRCESRDHDADSTASLEVRHGRTSASVRSRPLATYREPAGCRCGRRCQLSPAEPCWRGRLVPDRRSYGGSRQRSCGIVD